MARYPHCFRGSADTCRRALCQGCLSEEVRVRLTGYPWWTPFQFKNFQTWSSALDPATVERIFYTGRSSR